MRMAFRKLLPLGELWPGEMQSVKTAFGSILLINLDGHIYAYEDRCAHLGLPLSAGQLHGCVLTCAAHEWQYDARTGGGLNPRHVKLRPLPAKVEDGAIWVDVDLAPAIRR